MGAKSFVSSIWLASFGIIVASGILPPLLLRYARRERRRSLTPIPDWLIDVTLVFFAVVLAYSIISAVFGWSSV